MKISNALEKNVVTDNPPRSAASRGGFEANRPARLARQPAAWGRLLSGASVGLLGSVSAISAHISSGRPLHSHVRVPPLGCSWSCALLGQTVAGHHVCILRPRSSASMSASARSCQRKTKGTLANGHEGTVVTRSKKGGQGAGLHQGPHAPLCSTVLTEFHPALSNPGATADTMFTTNAYTVTIDRIHTKYLNLVNSKPSWTSSFGLRTRCGQLAES